MKIESLNKTSFDTLYTTFNEAFKSYEVQVNKDELLVMLKRRGFVPELSFGAFENNKLVSFTLNGIGMFNGQLTAYDTGTGTIEAFSGKGIASQVFTDSIPYLKAAGISQYLLEVLQHNTNAVSVYKKLGFIVSREFNYFKQTNTEVKLLAKDLPVTFSIKEISIDNKDRFVRFWDFNPSWQNSFEAIQRCATDFKIIGAHLKQNLVGYCIFEPNSGDITQIAIDKGYRRIGIGSALFNEQVRCNRYPSVKAINSEITCKEMTAFMESKNIPLTGKQFEMIKKL
ncbi:MAG: GNAT family N-acetyltransferase [Bacteroidales bacterium]|nr:GNAT family N-acetyltransferase [Bacteroidales bacterium]